jgi:hypothetical protein
MTFLLWLMLFLNKRQEQQDTRYSHLDRLGVMRQILILKILCYAFVFMKNTKLTAT